MPDHRIEFFYTAGCANAEATLPLLQEVVDALLPEVGVQQILVRDEAHALELAFPGSPTIRVDGVDLEGKGLAGVGLS